MTRYPFCLLTSTFFALTSMTAFAVPEGSSLIKTAKCTGNNVHVVFSGGVQKDIAMDRDYKCSNLKISSDHHYVGWKSEGTITPESDDQKKTFPDATIYVLSDGQRYAATQNSRYINNWFFVKGKPEIVAETAFEHGPSTFVLYDIAKKETIETCEQSELTKCPRLQKLILLGPD